MKKLLVASTALVAFAAVNSAQAAEPIKLSIGGFMNQHVGYVDQENDLNGDANSEDDNFTEVNINSETELYFRGSTKLDNGLTVSVNIDRPVDRDDGDAGDDVFLQVSSESLGRIRIGQTKGAAYALSHTAPDVALGNNDGDLGNWIEDTLITSDQTHTASESNDGQKIVYWTPNLGGFQAGFSYGVDTNGAGIEGPINLDANAADRAADVGVAYDGDFGGVSVGVDVTYQRNFAGGNDAVKGSDRSAWRTGFSVATAGFTVGGSYRSTDNEGYNKDRDASGWDLGVAYETGPYGVSFSYLELKEDDGAGQEDEAKSWILGASYDLGAGVQLIGSVFGVEYEDASNTTPNNNSDHDGFGVVTGLNVSF